MNFVFGLLTQCGIYAILCLSLNLIMGYGGMFHLGHGALFAVGAYTAALVAVHLGLPFIVELLIAALVAALFGLLIAFPAIRLRGDYLSFATFGFAVVIYSIANNWMEVTGGPIGIPNIPAPTIFGVRFTNGPLYFLLVLVLCFISWFVIRRIVKAPYGRTIESTREDEVAAAACGRNVDMLRITIFLVGSFFAGVAGTLYVHYVGIADPTGFTTQVSFTIVSMVYIGGAGSLSGPVAGAVLVVLVPELLKLIGLPVFYADQLKNVIYSLALILIMIKRPQGLLGKLKF